MKRILKTRLFMRWMRKTDLTDALLEQAIVEMQQGLIDAKLGGNLFKKRVALPYRGKSGSVRTIIATNIKTRWIFVFGFEKNERDNINKQELEFLQRYAKALLACDDATINALIERSDLGEINYEEEK
ncbi:MAG: type II toxin-antitoxin system RelE/ParE family toxin [Deltaproteobacteria bacterium]|nr:type II toxin-antitoxin system RelE/ParE family toxin [Deltaproteobacteria bacterium]